MDFKSSLQKTLGDSYSLERELEGGGMARVFVARDEQLGRKVVVKTLANDSGVSVSAERFRREIRLAASLQQANIIPVHSAGDVDGVPYYTMPFVEGQSLRAHMDARGALDVREAVNILRDVARALAFAHERGVVHRDIKPENILLSGSTAVVTDFGIAKAIEASHSMAGATTLTQLGTLLGTPAYLSPEQAAGDPQVDHLADIYSLGVVAYEMLAGSRPFVATTARALLAAHVTETPPPLASKRDGLPPRLASLVMRCLEKEPARRPQKAGDLLDALEGALAPSTASMAGTIPTIAVLPFANLSPDAADGSFADGLTDEIITDLSGLKALRVIARAAMMRYKETEKEPAVVARELRVRYVLDGSVRRAGDSMRLTARLLDTDTDSTVWSEKLSGKVEDVFEMQERVSRTIVNALKLTLTPREERQLAERPFEDLRAYEAYLQAKQGMWSFGPASLQRARELIQLAISRVGENPLLVSALGFIAIHAISAGGADIAAEAVAAEECARKLARLAPDSFGRYALEGLLHWRKGEIREAIATLSSAHEREPSNVDVVAYLEYAYLMAGRDDRARETSRLVVALDPVTPLMQVMPTFCDLMTGRAREVLDAYTEFASREPLNPLAQFWLLSIRAEGGDVPGMRETATDLVSRWPASEFGHAAKITLELLDNPSTASALVVPPAIRALSAESESIARSLTWLFGRLGAHEAALDALQDAINRGLAHFPHLARDCQSLAGARTHPRFQRLLAIVRERWERGGTSAEDLTRIASIPRAMPSARPVIAVLPLANMSASTEDEYFADGMTEDIIAQLSQIASLKVISRTSVMRHKRSERPSIVVGKELGATHVIEGSVRRAGASVRIVTQLIDAATEAHLWAETFDREVTDVFAIQSEVAGRVADALRSRVTAEERTRIQRRPTDDLEAYNLFLLGRHHWYHAGHPGAIERAIDCYSRAIARDPEFARAHGMLAEVYCWHGGGYFGMRPRDAGDQILKHASRALELDPDSIEAQYGLAYLALFHRFDGPASAKHIAKGLALNPSASELHILDAFHKAYSGDARGAIEAANRACDVDPASLQARGDRVLLILWAGRLDDALASLQEAEAALGDDFFLCWTRTMLMQAFGRTREIIDYLAEWRKRVPAPLSDINYGIALAAAGEVTLARAVLASLERKLGSEYIWPTGLAWLYAECGDMDRAFEMLSRACDDRAGLVSMLLCCQAFDRFRGDPRFDVIVKRIGAKSPPGWTHSRPSAIELAARASEAAAPVKAAKPVVAVLPLTNMSASDDDEYFADGMTEDIIAQLSQIASLKVIARTSAMGYKKSTSRPREIAAELGASHVIEGSVRRAGNRVRIVAQLMDAKTEAHLWSETFDRDLTDIFAIQSELAQRIAAALVARLSPAEARRVARRPTMDMEAYNLFLLGRQEYNKVSPQAFARAEEYYDQAIARDPLFARAYAAKALVHMYHGGGYWGVKPTVAYDRAVTLARKAIELDPDVGEAHMVLGAYESWIRFDWAASEAHFARAIALNPSHAFTHIMHGWLLFATGRVDEAVQSGRVAVELDPAAPLILGNALSFHYIARRPGDFDVELGAARRLASMDGVDTIVRTFESISRGQAGEILPEVRALARGADNIFLRALHAWCAAAAGADDESRTILGGLHALERTEYVWATGFALTYAHLGESEKAFEYLERAWQDRAGWLNVLGCSPAFDPFRGDPRFDAIVRRVGVAVAPEVAKQKFKPMPARRLVTTLKPQGEKRSVAVLPFANLSPDPENEFFAEGITDDLIAQVAKIGSLRVIARTSVMKFRGTQDAARNAARELGVGAVVEGTVRRAGKRARIVAQLIDASSDATVWSETYDRDLDDVFSVQTEVATSVAAALKASLTPAEERRLARQATKDAKAYDIYLIGRHHYNRRTPESLKSAMAHFEQAIARDPQFAAAHAGLADAYVFAGIGYATIPPVEAFAKAKASAQRALDLDPESPEALCAMGLALMHGDWNGASSRACFDRAIVANPNHAVAHQFLAWGLFAQGEYAVAVDSQRRALELDPLNVSLVTEQGWPYSYAGLHDIARTWYERAIDLDPGFGLGHYNLGITHYYQGRVSEAKACCLRAIEFMGPSPWVVTYLAIAHFDLGEKEECESLLMSLREQARAGIATWLSIAMILDCTGRTDEAFEALDRAFAEHEPFVWALGIEGWFRLPNARGQPRFAALMSRIGIKPHDMPRQRELLLAHAKERGFALA